MNGCWRQDYSYHKMNEIRSPAMRLVFTEEEDRDGANWGSWILGSPGTDTWWDPLAAWYAKSSASIFGFADGHAERRIWKNQNTKDWIQSQGLGHSPPANQVDDVQYMHKAYHHNYK
jgi:hypothetical protein